MDKRISLTLALAACSFSNAVLAQDEPGESVPSADATAPAADDQQQAPTPASPAAAGAPAPTTADSGGLEEIVVTATRREERLQDIPVTVTAITARTLGSAGLVEARNLTQVVPGFTGSRNMGVNQPVIRGVGSSGISTGDESNVATYIDGIYQADPFSTFLEFVEVERVEVLRGPQGTVFGRNATGGLVNIITPDPSFTTRGRIAGRYGRMRNSAGDYDFRAYITGPLSSTLAADVAGVYRGNDGYIKDLVRGGELGQARVIDVRSKLLFQPNDDIKIVLMGEHADSDTRANAVQPFNDITMGKLFPGYIPTTGPWQASLSFLPELDYERYNVALRTQFDLGAVSLETSTGYMKTDIDQSTDSDASNVHILSLPFHSEVKTISQEIRLLSQGGGRFNWILGAYGFGLKGFMDVFLDRGPYFPGPLANVDGTLYPEIKTTSYAGFAEGTYQLLDRLFLTLGGRYTTEKREFRQQVNGRQLDNTLPPFFPAGGTAKKKFNKWTYRAALRYNFADDANIFLSYGTGFKSGVFNAIGTSPIATDPETIKAWEGGIKADPLSWLRTNLSIFHYDYRDLQVQSRSGAVYLLQNAASATIYGGELEVTAAVNNDFNLRGSLAYTHGEYDEFPRAQTYIPRPNNAGNFEVEFDASGKRIIRTPRMTGNLGFDWGFDIGGGRGQLVGNIFRSGKVYYDFRNIFAQKAYTLASGEMSWSPASAPWRFSLWGTNLTNAKVVQQIRPGVFSSDVHYEKPRRLGVGAEYKF